MEYLNDEMDDLFRKAGEHYPLKTSDSDWDAVLGRLQPAAGDQNPVDGNEIPKKRNNKNRRFFWLLLLLPLGLFSIKYFPSGNKNDLKSNTGQTKIPAPNEAADSRSAGNQPAKTSDHSVNAGHPVSTPLPETKNRASVHADMPASQDYSRGNASLNDRKNKPTLHYTYGNTLANKQVDRSSQASDANTESSSAADPGISPDNSSATHSGTVQDDHSTTSSATGNKTAQVESAQPGSVAPVLPDQPDKSAQTDSAKDSARLSAQDQKGKKKETIPKQKERGIYLSALAGPDLSSVRFQSVKSMGYSFGLLIGYRFNQHISLESGVYWDKKEYYSDGEYFNKSKTGIPSSVKIKDINGNCGMFEIPVSFRYDFGFGRKGRFFSTAGLNSYIMKKENYDYTTNDYPGWSRKVSYNNSSNNLFSILQLSAGYEYKLGKIGRIRIEPYLNIPLKGVGIGSMPISSAGLHLGITIPFR